MPTIPVWFQARDYFGNKLATMSYADAADGAEQLMNAFNAAGFTIAGLNSAQLNESAEQLYRHFVEYGNEENVSPNNYFNVEYYTQQKIAQLATTTQTPPYPFTTWTRESLDAAMEDAGLSYWDHYAKYGTGEGINPSAQFNTNAYLDAKAAQLNALPADQKQLLPDGTEGAWTRELVAEALANADLSALEHYYDYGIAEKVAYQPLPEVQPEVYYKAVDLANMESPVVGTPDNENFIGTVGGADATLARTDIIDGGNGLDKLTVTMNGDFAGFQNENALTNVEAVELTNPTRIPHTFNAQNTDGVQTWTLNSKIAPINLTNLPGTGVTVNINDLAGNKTAGIGFAPDANLEADDEMSIGLSNVGSAATRTAPEADAFIRMAGVENVNINASGDNFTNLTQMTNVETLGITGAGNLKVVAAAPTVANVEASSASGNLDLNLSTSNNFENAALGSGNDTLRVTNVQETSAFDGGDGTDNLILDSVVRTAGNPTATAVGNYTFQMKGIETMTVQGLERFQELNLRGDNTVGLETLVLDDISQQRGVVFGNYDANALTVQTSKNFDGYLELNDLQEVNLNVGKNDATRDNVGASSRITLEDTYALNIHVGGTASNGDQFNGGNIIAPNLNTLTIDNDRNAGQFILGNASELGSVSQLDLTGFGDINLSGSNIGGDQQAMSVNASGLHAAFTGAFTGNQPNSIITVTGADQNNNSITINGSYTNVNVVTGTGNDNLFLNLQDIGSNGIVNVDLGTGRNHVNYIGSQDQMQALIANGSIRGVTMDDTTQTASNVSGSSVILTSANPGIVAIAGGQTATYTATPSGSAASNVDFTGLTFSGSDNGIVINDIKSGSTGPAVVKLGETGANGAELNVNKDTTSFDLYMTKDDTVATINAASDQANAATWTIKQSQPGVDIDLNLSTASQNDTIEVGVSASSQAGSWTALTVKNFGIKSGSYGTDVLDMGSLYYVQDTNQAKVTQWLSQAGITDVNNLSRDTNDPTDNSEYWHYEDANGQTNTVIFAVNTSGPNAGCNGIAVVLLGVNTSISGTDAEIGITDADA